MNDDRRLIEDYLPIEAISKEASREKSVRKGHISTLHLWWARRPLVACRAAVYGALVPATRFRPANGPEEKRDSLTRANAAKFVERLCQYPGVSQAIAEAQKHILEAHAERLSTETGKAVTVEDIVEGRAPRPKVLDMFAGGGAIPLEALRLGCEAYALDLNPVAHIIELCTLVYPQKYGKADPNIVGKAGPKNEKGETTWGGLADEVRFWGEWVLDRVREEVGDLYPLIPDPQFKGERGQKQTVLWAEKGRSSRPSGYLTPVAYLWTRTVRCKNPACGATVPLVKQTWLSNKEGRVAALKMTAPRGTREVRFNLVTVRSKSELGFDPEGGSYRGTAVCRFCGTVAENTYVMEEGCADRIGAQLMCVVASSEGQPGKIYLTPGDYPGLAALAVPNATQHPLWGMRDMSVLAVEIPSDRRESFWCRRYGITRFDQAFTARQKLLLSSFSHWAGRIRPDGDRERDVALRSYITLVLGKLADYNSSLCHWHSSSSAVTATFARQALPMVWDYPEINPFAGVLADAKYILSSIGDVICAQANSGPAATVHRSSATTLPYPAGTMDAVITDPPYYDNISYSKLADYFYVWFKQGLQADFAEHFTSAGTPKKQEAVVDFARAGGDRERARREYEDLMAASFKEAHRVLKDRGQCVCVYAHKTTMGWASLVATLRIAGFEIREAWPLDTEMKTRVRAIDSASLATSIFLVARKRESSVTGSYEDEVRPELDQIVRERVDTLWKMGIVGADLVIAAVGAGLRAFTRFGRVEYANGEEVPAERFLAEVEGVVLETLLEKIFGLAGSGVSTVDGQSRFYVLWRFTYKACEIDAGEAIVFTYGQNVELDGQRGLSSGSRPLVEKKKTKYRLRDFEERGENEKLGVPGDGRSQAPLIDTLHRILWLLTHQPRGLNAFLDEAQPDRDRLRLLAQALSGAGLSGRNEESEEPLVTTTASEQAAVKRLLANWRPLIEERLSNVDLKTGQIRMPRSEAKK